MFSPVEVAVWMKFSIYVDGGIYSSELAVTW